jgi:hypothetical protein
MIHGSETDMIANPSGQYRTISTVKLIVLTIILLLTLLFRLILLISSYQYHYRLNNNVFPYSLPW